MLHSVWAKSPCLCTERSRVRAGRDAINYLSESNLEDPSEGVLIACDFVYRGGLQSAGTLTAFCVFAPDAAM